MEREVILSMCKFSTLIMKTHLYYLFEEHFSYDQNISPSTFFQLQEFFIIINKLVMDTLIITVYTLFITTTHLWERSLTLRCYKWGKIYTRTKNSEQCISWNFLWIFYLFIFVFLDKMVMDFSDFLSIIVKFTRKLIFKSYTRSKCIKKISLSTHLCLSKFNFSNLKLILTKLIEQKLQNEC